MNKKLLTKDPMGPGKGLGLGPLRAPWALKGSTKEKFTRGRGPFGNAPKQLGALGNFNTGGAL